MGESLTPAELQANRRRGVKTLFHYEPTLNAALTKVKSSDAETDHYILSVKRDTKAADAYHIFVTNNQIIINHPARKLTIDDSNFCAMRIFGDWLTQKNLHLPKTKSEANGSTLRPRVPVTTLKR